jgi:hypothetical protein
MSAGADDSASPTLRADGPVLVDPAVVCGDERGEMESRVKGTVKLRMSDVMVKVLKVINTSSPGFEAAVKGMARPLFIADAAAYCRVVSLLAGGMFHALPHLFFKWIRLRPALLCMARRSLRSTHRPSRANHWWKTGNTTAFGAMEKAKNGADVPAMIHEAMKKIEAGACMHPIMQPCTPADQLCASLTCNPSWTVLLKSVGERCTLGGAHSGSLAPPFHLSPHSVSLSDLLLHLVDLPR